MQRPDIIAPSPLPPAWQQWARRRPLQAALLAIAALGIGVLLAATVLLSLASRLAETRLPGGLLSRLWPAPTATPTPVPPAAQGFFTVALARFPLQDQAGRLTETDDTRWLSNWLFAALQEQERPSTDLGARYLGPDEVQAVTGAGPDERAAAAEQVAARLHAGVLIYGVVTEADGAYHVRPEFYVSHEGFSYGSELTGPERLGAELRFPQPLLKNAADLSAANEDVIARRRALQYTVYGLSHYALRRYEDAWDDFDKASRAWGQGKGLEVIYLLQGAARLELYDVETDPARRREALDQAEQAFARAQALNPAYARSYLGLGAVALQRALQVNPGAGGACQAGPAATAGPLSTSDAGPQQFAARLAEARDWYARSLSAAERPPQAGVDIKADYGLASAGFLACSSGGCQEPACLPGWSTSETQAQFEQVIQAYQRDRSPDAAFLAGTAYCLRSLLDNGANRYRFRAAACQTSAEMLEKLQGGLPYNWIARSWAEVALAEDRQASGESGSTAHRCAAVRAYRRALDNGRKKLPSGQPQAVDDTLLKAWEQRRLQLAEGVTCGDS